MWVALSRAAKSGGRNGPRKFFSELKEQHFEQSQWLTQDELDGLLRSISVIATRSLCVEGRVSLERGTALMLRKRPPQSIHGLASRLLPPRLFMSSLILLNALVKHVLLTHRLPRCSHVALLRPESEQLRASRHVRELIETHQDTRDKLHTSGKVELFYDTEVYWCRKLL